MYLKIEIGRDQKFIVGPFHTDDPRNNPRSKYIANFWEALDQLNIKLGRTDDPLGASIDPVDTLAPGEQAEILPLDLLMQQVEEANR